MNYKKIKKYITGDREPFFNIACKYIKQDSVILDVGAGDGAFAKTINRSDIYMLDGNEGMVENLKRNFPNYNYGQLPKLPYGNIFFDLIHTSHLIEHLSPQQLYDFLGECDRCLKDNGYLIISAPIFWAEFYDDMSHIKPYNPKLFEKYLCWGVECCCTRPLISKNYIVKEKIYRYNILPYDNLEVFIYSEIINKIFLFIKKIKYIMGFRKLEISGFTLVMQKKGE